MENDNTYPHGFLNREDSKIVRKLKKELEFNGILDERKKDTSSFKKQSENQLDSLIKEANLHSQDESTVNRKAYHPDLDKFVDKIDKETKQFDNPILTDVDDDGLPFVDDDFTGDDDPDEGTANIIDATLNVNETGIIDATSDSHNISESREVGIRLADGTYVDGKIY